MLGIVGMVAIANLQYGWTLFVNPIDSKFHWGKTAIQIAFTLFVLAETWLVPFEGYLVDRFGPRALVAIGGVLVGGAWWINAGASSLFALYAGGFIGGVGPALSTARVSATRRGPAHEGPDGAQAGHPSRACDLRAAQGNRRAGLRPDQACARLSAVSATWARPRAARMGVGLL